MSGQYDGHGSHEIVLSPGDALVIPAFTFHQISTSSSSSVSVNRYFPAPHKEFVADSHCAPPVQYQQQQEQQQQQEEEVVMGRALAHCSLGR